MDFSLIINILHYVLWIPLLMILWNQTIVNILGSIIVTIIISELIVIYLKTKNNPQLLDKLSSRAVLVTGCDTGIGHALAKQLDGLGVTVYAGCLFPNAQGALDLKNQCSSDLHILHLDVTNEEHILSATKYVNETLNGRKLWAIVNNAGTAFPGLIEMSPMHEIKKVVDVNIIGMIAVTKSFLPLLRSCKGRVVVVSSPLGSFPVPYAASYCFTKAAVTSFCESLRDELRAVGVSVHTIMPYSYETTLNSILTVENKVEELWDKSSEEIKNAYGQEFFSKMIKFTKLFGALRKSSTKLSEVTNEIVAACFSCHPETTYFSGSFEVKVLLSLMTTIPISMQRIAKSPASDIPVGFIRKLSKFWKIYFSNRKRSS